MDRSLADTAAAEQVFFPSYVRQGKDQCTFEMTLSAKHHWMLREHRIGQFSALPATGFLELAFAACRLYFHWFAIEITKLTISQPLLMQPDEEAKLRILFTGDADQATFSITCLRSDGNSAVHVTGTAARVVGNTDLKFDVAACKTVYQTMASHEQQTGVATDAHVAYQLAFGRRWLDVYRQVWRSADKGIALLSLDPAFVSDVDTYLLHPALLDVAITLLLDNPMLAPFQFRSIRHYRPLPAQYYCHATSRSAAGGIETDIVIADVEGNILLEIDKYYLLEVSEDQLTSMTGN
ncbi:polyketide synthase dehydratase domain-containing protein [Chitinophaga rhizophila]|uniref:Polyketide synthase dehydratase domain-containing protein n=1 Tax=Chitinophaga rhizophila TaxID=2866212 RepID=A0ABS7GKM6_9BACT|nr:polyketide synthase dehydratase domain-containing protein [Chitinophaga rhizophila]MBW8687197.1 polyketide synthase dehydratase domain-containing protein [Chitinophaga rhizophila]